MSGRKKTLLFGALALLLSLNMAAGATGKAGEAEILLFDNFDTGNVGPKGTPAGWEYYQQGTQGGVIELIPEGTGRAVRLTDATDDGEIGIARKFEFKPGFHYRAGIKARRTEADEESGFILQLSFFGPDRKPVNYPVNLRPAGKEYERFRVEGQAPADTTGARIYLYSRRKPVGRVVVDDFQLEVNPVAFPPLPRDPGREFNALEIRPRELYRSTRLVRDGQPTAAIVVSEAADDQALAKLVNDVIKEKTGLELPVVADSTLRDLKTLDRNYIMIGNRDSNQAIEKLYYLHHVILDATYPGAGGRVVRSCHNPLGDRHNVIFAGGSDAEGNRAAAGRLAEIISLLPGGDDLELDYLADLKLPESFRIPSDAYRMPVWDAAFGWNRISKNLALLYHTGEEKYAREFLRLAFPTPEVVEELRKDDEDYDDARDPLVKPYHYRSIRMMLYWDMVEESPWFTDEQRVAVTKKFYEQLNFWRTFGFQGGYKIFSVSEPRKILGDRHFLWEALSVYVVARYFDTHYPCFDSREGMRTVANVFAPLKKSAAKRIGTMHWYTTFTEPVITYAALSGGREYENSPVIDIYGKTLLAHTDLSRGDWALASAGAAYFGQLAALLNDEAYAKLLPCIGARPNEFRLGQSYWPVRKFARNSLDDIAGKFIRPEFDVQAMDYPFLPEGFAPEEVVELESYHQNPDASGDFLLADTKYETGGRNPFHNFTLVSLRLAGLPILRGYGNTVSICNNGIATGRKSFYTRIHDADKLGATVFLSGTVPDFNNHDWNRVFLLRENRFLVIVDRVTPRNDTGSTLIENGFEGLSGSRCEMSPLGEFTVVNRRRVPVRSAEVPVSLDSSELLDAVNYPDRYYSGLLGCAGFRAVEAGGESVVIPFALDRETELKLSAYMVNHNDYRGLLRFKLDGRVVVPEFDHQARNYQIKEVLLHHGPLAAGNHTVEIETISGPGGEKSSLVTMLGLVGTTPAWKPEPDSVLISSTLSGQVEIAAVGAGIGSSGQVMKYVFDRPGQGGRPVDFVSLVRFGETDSRAAATAERDGLFALRLPEPALLIRQGDGFILKEKDHVFGYHTAELPGIRSWAEPVFFDCDLTTGRLEVRTRDGRSSSELIDPARYRDDHARNVRLAEDILAGRTQPETYSIAAPEVRPDRTLELPGAIGSIFHFRSDGRDYFAAAAGKTLTLFDADGQILRTIETADVIGPALYWPEASLLMVGCKDEQLIAYRLTGEKAWSFTSEMSTELFESAKYYWFKSAIPGVLSLATGELKAGEPLLFAGSAGTVEVLDPQGRLQGRLWASWGGVTELAMLPSGDHPGRLLNSRMMGGHPESYAVGYYDGKLGNRFFGMNQSLDGTFMGGFGFNSIGRSYTIPVQLKKDGPLEIIGAFNGSQNRLMAWTPDGKAVREVEIGSGRVAQSMRYGVKALSGQNIRGLAVADIDGDGDQEIALAFSRKLLLLFDADFQVRFLARLPEEPTALAAGKNSAGLMRLAVGVNGKIYIFDATGQAIAAQPVSGVVASLLIENGKLYAGSDRGRLTIVKLP